MRELRYGFRCNQRRAPIPTRPRPSRESEAGSGTDAAAGVHRAKSKPALVKFGLITLYADMSLDSVMELRALYVPTEMPSKNWGVVVSQRVSNVAHMLGHANISQTSTYLNATRVGLQDAMRRLDASRCTSVAQTSPIEQRLLATTINQRRIKSR